MANFSENYGLDFLMDDSAVSGFLGHIIEKGKCIRGYYGYPYFYEPFGDVEYWIKTESDSKGELTVAAIDSHCGGGIGGVGLGPGQLLLALQVGGLGLLQLALQVEGVLRCEILAG